MSDDGAMVMRFREPVDTPGRESRTGEWLV